MGKKRIIGAQKEGETTAEGQPKAAVSAKKAKRSIEGPIFSVEATYNNTKASITDKRGNVIAWSSAGSLGFKGAKKGTPFAAAKVGEVLGDKAAEYGIKEVDVVVCGVGSGRESSIRGFISKSININTIKDVTPVPHNGPKPKKPRRV
jgi:small subunit ribosomal protein S11